MEQKASCKEKEKIQYLIFSAAVIAVLVSISVYKAQGIFFPTDEFGYWSNAAGISGNDISKLPGVVSDYAPGYSMLLVPLYIFSGSPMAMYRAALLLNAMLMLLMSVMFIRLVSFIYGKPRMFIMPCLLFPSYFIYMSYTISEVFLYVLFLVLCCVMIRISVGERSLLTIGEGLAAGLLMTVTHYRVLGIMIIYVMICILILLGDRVSGNKVLIISSVVICMLFAAMIIYSNTGGKISAKTFGLSFVVDLMMGMMGKIFYVGVSTFGTGIVALSELIKKRKEPFNLFLLLSFLYMAILGSFYFAGGTRLDQPVYGRYGELFIPILMYIGMIRMTDRRDIMIEGIVRRVLILMGMIALMLTGYVSFLGINEYVADFVNGIDWMFGKNMPKVSNVYIIPFAISGLILIVMERLLRQERSRVMVTAVLTALFVFVAVFLSWKHVWRFQDINRSDRLLAEMAMDYAGEGKDVIFLNSPYKDYVNLLYFWFEDTDINVIEGLSPEAFLTSEEAVVITYMNYECDYQLAERYDNRISSTHFDMYVSGMD